MVEPRKMTGMQAIVEYFSQQVSDYPVRKPDINELKLLSKEEREYFKTGCLKALGAVEA